MGTAGDIRARLRAKFSRRQSAAPSLASTKSAGDTQSSQLDATSLIRQSSTARTASSSRDQHLHQPHLQPQSQSQPHSPSQPQTPRHGSPEPGSLRPGSGSGSGTRSGASSPLLQRLKAITATRADRDAEVDVPVPRDEESLHHQSSSPAPTQDHDEQKEHDGLQDHHVQGTKEPRSSTTVIVTDSSTGTENSTPDEHRQSDAGEDDKEMQPPQPHSPASSPQVATPVEEAPAPAPEPALVMPAPSPATAPAPLPFAASDRRSANDSVANDLRPSSATTGIATAPSSNLPSIHEDPTPPAEVSSHLPSVFAPVSVSALDEKKQDLLQPLSLPQLPPNKTGALPAVVFELDPVRQRRDDDQFDPLSHALGTPTPLVATLSPTSPKSPRPDGPPRRQSLLPNRQTTLIRTLLDATHPHHEVDHSTTDSLISIHGNMVTRKVWVRRPGASPTLITINEDDLVDDVRDMILRKYANSLGRQFDSPDLTLRICPREQRQDRLLGPEEPMSRTLDAYYPGGQNVDEALVIDIPARRTPRPSPRAPSHPTAIYFAEETRPSEAGEGYFPPVGAAMPSPNLPVPVVAPVTVAPVLNAHAVHPHGTHAQHSIAVLGTGQIPPIPSPGGTRSRAYRERPERPRLGRTHTSSPTILNTANAQSMAAAAAAAASHPSHSFHPRLPPSRTHSNTSDQAAAPPAPPPLPTPPAPEVQQVQRVATPPPRVASPRTSARPKKTKKATDHPTLPSGILNGGVPPINVLIVEDNPINLKLLEAFVKRLKVRWKTAVNGRDAVTMWRTGGFHLVLMDIQLPVMNGLDATREIRRLERVNSIGVFSSSASSAPELTKGELEEKDRLTNMELFKSPVIIVALTASSLQSDRHEALAAGCNDFLTKPVNFVWLERKVMEWGCMQALIDFDGWRRWKDFSQKNDEAEAAKKSAALKTKAKKNRLSMTSVPA
ncbi:Response regulator mcs4 [Colletotrichum sidae]|uniref:Response regulator mcs4 n=1 Tax=Colletotrichum sidae TaxID=1347389 RepID=A0A4R8TNC3_9PEZI|nr:Response regulator mcs4 [Colletotrichum sidae]